MDYAKEFAEAGGQESSAAAEEKPVEQAKAEQKPVAEEQKAEKAVETEAAEGETEEKTPVEGEKAEGEEEIKPTDGPIKLGDKEYEREELEEIIAYHETATKKIGEANERIELTNNLVSNLIKRPADTLLAAFTDVYKGDSNKAYNHIVQLAEHIVANQLKLQAMPESERRALEKEREVAELRRQLKEQTEQAGRKKAEEEETLLEAQFDKEIRDALSGAKQTVSDEAVAEVAEIMLKAREAGVQATAVQATARRIKLKAKSGASAKLRIEDIPPELVEQIRKSDLETVKSSRRPGQATKTQVSRKDAAERPATKVVKMSDWDDVMNGKW